MVVANFAYNHTNITNPEVEVIDLCQYMPAYSQY